MIPKVHYDLQLDDLVQHNHPIEDLLTGFTPGSVLFAGAGGLVSEDNSNLFWDDTNKFLGIGTATPATSLDVISDTIIPPIYIRRYYNSAETSAGFVGYKARGTPAVPLPVLSGDYLASFSARGYHSGGDFAAESSGWFGFIAEEDFTATAQGTAFIIETMPIGKAGHANRTERLRIDNAGNIGIGTSTPNPNYLLNLFATSPLRPGILFEQDTVSIPDYSTRWPDFLTTNTAGMLTVSQTGYGGLAFHGYTEMKDRYPLSFTGMHGTTDTSTTPALVFRGGKWDGVSDWAVLADTEILAAFRKTPTGSSTGTDIVRIYGNGDTSLIDGKLLFGTAGSEDTNLYRSAADVLKTDDTFDYGTALKCRGTTATGRATLTGGSSSVNVTFDVAQADTNYSISITPGYNAGNVYYTNKATTGFTINVTNTSAYNQTIDWMIMK